MDQYQEYIALSRYARWLPDKQRRETWTETVKRYTDYWYNKDLINVDEEKELRYHIENLEVMPSMRCLMTAGKALDRDNVAGFNCSYIVMNRQRAFDEMMYILMCGTGVGFSCERQEIAKLPTITDKFNESDTTIVVRDSKIGWATAFRELISLLYSGTIPKWDLSKIRPEGSPLKTFGGRASGPGPLNDLFTYSTDLFRNSAGRKLTSIEVHGLACKIAAVVVVGGVRRSALISLSNLSDDRMRHAKSGQWWSLHPEYSYANNSVAYTEKPDIETFMREWLALMESKSGERGIFNRAASTKQASKNGRRDPEYEFGTNPCSEIILRDRQFCNLSEVVIRNEDTLEDLKRKVRIATILGTLQATLTDFRYLSPKWKENTEEEALLGVSLTGIMDHPIMSNSACHEDDIYKCYLGDGIYMPSSDPYIYEPIDYSWENFDPENKTDGILENVLKQLKEVAIETNKEWSNRLGINQSVAVTCVKPSGTVSQLVNSSSGIHARHSLYNIRTVRADRKDPLAQYMVEAGFPYEEAIGNPSTLVFSFPIKSPDGAIVRNDRSAIEQLELWLTYQRYWCEHKPSVTINVKDKEWMEVGAWVWEHFDELSGVSFLPYDGGSYQQAPYQEITESEFEELSKSIPKADWSQVSRYEASDMTIGSQELACTGGSCEIF